MRIYILYFMKYNVIIKILLDFSLNKTDLKHEGTILHHCTVLTFNIIFIYDQIIVVDVIFISIQSQKQKDV